MLSLEKLQWKWNFFGKFFLGGYDPVLFCLFVDICSIIFGSRRLIIFGYRRLLISNIMSTLLRPLRSTEFLNWRVSVRCAVPCCLSLASAQLSSYPGYFQEPWLLEISRVTWEVWVLPCCDSDLEVHGIYRTMCTVHACTLRQSPLDFAPDLLS